MQRYLHQNSTYSILNSLELYKLCKQLCLDVYALTNRFPPEEKYNIVDQIRRASSSIAANLAEPYFNSSSREKIRFLNISRRSLSEVIFFLDLSLGLQYLSQADFDNLLNQLTVIDIKLHNYKQSLKQKA